MDKNKILQILLENKYYTIDDLRYNKNVGILFSKDELNDFLDTKEMAFKRLSMSGLSNCFFISSVISSQVQFLSLTLKVCAKG